MKALRRAYSWIASPEALLWMFPLLLVIPNVALAVTEQTSALSKLADIILPLGIYYIIFSLSRNVGRTILLCLPLMVYAAFQLVLLYLYRESIIAVDMFLNVATTNIGEVKELLGNLTVAIIIVCAIYLPPIIRSTALIIHGKKAEKIPAAIPRTGIALTATGVALICICYATVQRYDALKELFPANVISNTVQAVRRSVATSQYHERSAGFDFGAGSERPSDLKEIYLLVIGETSRAENWQLCGYRRETNPRLSKRDDIIFFDKVLSESNTTHKSVPLMLSPVTARTFGDSIYCTKSLLSAFRQAGFQTAFISNQRRNHSFIDFFADEAHKTLFINDDGRSHYDRDLLKPCLDFIAGCTSGKILVVLHTYGSHFRYHERYPATESHFIPDKVSDARARNSSRLTNAYDNSIRYTDAILADIIEALDSIACPSAMLYVSDHGEDIFDDSRKRFLHASPTPTYHQLHVPMLIWMSDRYRECFHDIYDTARRHCHCDVASSETVFDTMLSLAGITSRHSTPSKAVTDNSYSLDGRHYLNDYNESVDLLDSGLRTDDFTQLSSHGIAVR